MIQSANAELFARVKATKSPVQNANFGDGTVWADLVMFEYLNRELPIGLTRIHIDLTGAYGM